MNAAPTPRVALAALLAVTATLLAAVGVPTADGALTGSVRTTTDTAASNAYATCTSAARGEGTSDRAYFTLPFLDGSGLTATDSSGNGRNGSYSATGVTYGVAATVCPRDMTKVITLDGSTGNAYVNVQQASPGPQAFTLEIWFRSSSANGGELIGYGSGLVVGSTTHDRQLYIGADGKLVFEVGTGTPTTLTSAAAVNDGSWHQAIASYSAAAGMTLYLDGRQVGTTTATPASYAGYWRIGFDTLTGLPDAPASNYLAGSLAYASVYSYAFAADQVTSHYLAGR